MEKKLVICDRCELCKEGSVKAVKAYAESGAIVNHGPTKMDRFQDAATTVLYGGIIGGISASARQKSRSTVTIDTIYQG